MNQEIIDLLTSNGPEENVTTFEGRFIYELESRPAIWNCECPEYSNKIDQANAWEELGAIFHDNFSEKSSAERNELCRQMQRKWESLRDCYLRENNAQKKEEKSGSGKSNRRKYVYYEQLNFLQPTVLNKKTVSNLETESIQDEEDTSELNMELSDDHFGGAQGDASQAQNVNTRTFKRKKQSIEATELKFLDVMSKRLAQNETESETKKEVQDEDKLFLLSLVKEIKKIPDENKLDAKTDIIQVIKKWQSNSQIINQYQQTTNTVQQFSHNFHHPSQTENVIPTLTPSPEISEQSCGTSMSNDSNDYFL